MIGIKIGNEYTDIYPDTKVSLELVNPIFNEDNLSPGSLSWPFDLPCGEDSPKNSGLLGIPEVVENTEGFRKIDADLVVDDVPYKSGKLIVRGYDRNKANTNFNFGLRAKFGDDFKNRKLADVVAEPVTIWNPFTHSPTIYKRIYIKPGAGAVTPYEIDVNGRNYSNATLAGLASDISADTSEPRATATYEASAASPLGMAAPYIIIEPQTNPQNPISPLNVKFENNGFGPFHWMCHTFDNSGYNQIYKDFYTDHFADTRFSFPFVRNDNPYGEHLNAMYFSNFYEGFGSQAGGTKVTNKVNHAISGVLQVNDSNYGYNLAAQRPFVVNNINSMQPFIRMRHVLDKIALAFGFEYEGDFTTLADIDDMFLWNTAPLDVPMDFIGTKKFVFYRSGFDMRELVPQDLTVREFFMALQSRYNLSVDVNEHNGNMIINRREEYAKSKIYEDITGMCGQVQKQEDLRVTGYRLFCDRETTNDLHAIDQLEIDTPQEDIKILCKAFTSMTASQKMGSKFNLQIFYMPTGGSAGTPNAGAWDETLDGIDGIYEKFWKYWLYFQQRRRMITLPVTFPFARLNEFSWSQKLRFDRNNYMVKKINVDIGAQDDIGVSTVDLYSMY